MCYDIIAKGKSGSVSVPEAERYIMKTMQAGVIKYDGKTYKISYEPWREIGFPYCLYVCFYTDKEHKRVVEKFASLASCIGFISKFIIYDKG